MAAVTLAKSEGGGCSRVDFLDREDIADGLASRDAALVCKALNQIGGAGRAAVLDFLPEVGSVLRCPASPEVQCVALAAAARAGPDCGDGVAGAASELLGAPDRGVQHAAIRALGQMAPRSAAWAGPVATFLEDGDAALRAAAAVALGSMKASTYSSEICALLKDNFSTVVVAALGALGLLGEDALCGKAAIMECLTHEDCMVRAAAAGALGKLGDAAATSAGDVVDLLQDQNCLTRQAAVSFFEAMGTKAKNEAVSVAALLNKPDGRVRASSAMVLGFMKAEQFAPEVAGLLTDQYYDGESAAQAAAGAVPRLPAALRRPACAAALALGMMGKPGASSAEQVIRLVTRETSAPTEVVVARLQALGLMGAGAAEQAGGLRPMLDGAWPAPVRAAACFALGELARGDESEEAADAVGALLADRSSLVRGAAAGALGRMGEEGPRWSEEVCGLFNDKSAHVQEAALRAMGSFGEKGQVYATEVCRLMPRGKLNVRLAAIQVLGDMGDRGAALADELAPLLEDESAEVRVEVLKALAKMGEEAERFHDLIDSLRKWDEAYEVRDAAEESLKDLDLKS